MIPPEWVAKGHRYSTTRVNAPCEGCSTADLLVLECDHDDGTYECGWVQDDGNAPIAWCSIPVTDDEGHDGPHEHELVALVASPAVEAPDFYYGRYSTPIGPAPYGWRRLDPIRCSRVLPHNEYNDDDPAEAGRNAEMNEDHGL